ncbi:MAG: MMPL family transporter, partial [Actinobacteria bacterium]|nr:MMPL family transporter [Actinomycetota bacterium]
SYLFPNAQGGADTAIIQVRLEPGLSDERQARTIETIRAAVGMEDWRLGHGGQYLVTGAPVVVADLTDSITGSIIVLLIAAGLIMAATLALVFRTPLRLAPLAIALGAAALTFGALSLAGASLTMASIAVLPVLIGLAVDYAIQIQSRVEEARAGAPSDRGGAPPARSAAAASRRVARAGAPTVVTAAAATTAGFLVLLLSPVPMVQGFGALLVVGVVVALVLTLTAGVAALVLVHDGGGGGIPRRLAPALRGARDLLRPFCRAMGDLLGPLGRRGLALGRRAARVRPFAAVRRGARAGAARVRAGGHASLELAVRHPVRVLAVGVVLALAGWALDTQLEVESDITRLVPADLRALEDLGTLQEASGIGGTIDVLIEGDDLSDPAAIGWMVDYQQRVLDRAGFSSERGCGEAAVCPAFSLPDLLSGTTQAGQEAGRPGAQAFDALLAAALDLEAFLVEGELRVALGQVEDAPLVTALGRAQLDPALTTLGERLGQRLPVGQRTLHHDLRGDHRGAGVVLQEELLGDLADVVAALVGQVERLPVAEDAVAHLEDLRVGVGAIDGHRDGVQHRDPHPAWDQDDVHEIYRTWRKVADSYDPPRIFVAEAWLPSNERLALYLRPDELHTAFQFDFLRTPFDAEVMAGVIDDARAQAAAVGAPATWVLSNHDVVRHVTRYARSQPDHMVESGWDQARWSSEEADLELGRARARAAILL